MAIKHRTCKRCGYEWDQRLDVTIRPRQCPDCKSSRWDKEKDARFGESPSSSPEKQTSKLVTALG